MSTPDYSARVDPNQPAETPKTAVTVITSDQTFRPTQLQRDQVEQWVGLGLKYKDICQLVINPASGKPISVETLKRCFEVELKRGEPVMKVTLASKVFGVAYGHEAEFDAQGNQTRSEALPSARLLEFLAQTRLGWKKESVVQIEHIQDETVTIGEELKKMFAEAMEKSSLIMGNVESVKEPIVIDQAEQPKKENDGKSD